MSTIRVALMAAGRASRYGSCKLTALHPVSKLPLICHVIEQYQLAGLNDIVVLTGYWHKTVINALPAQVEVSRVPDWQLGLSASVSHATTLLAPYHTGLLIGLGDQAGVHSSLLNALNHQFTLQGKITACCEAERVAPPVIFPRHEVALLQQLSGDEGAGKHLRRLLKTYPNRIHCVATEPVIDIDTPQDWHKLN
ncbi:nucleotidyltransferase family protein [Alteromonas gilva]|uniref:Nucleotidyltransferase family protein n=1 Tax=Alteromonas gilva TaxID=2987522 RepID=A0ABT5L2D1_9ALTE|nr:nucleotidyltransferase family protein [Alteromonas gilva]MDC8831190.1 nucleotidyltransferase family protein [Alteromonas gilva]